MRVWTADGALDGFEVTTIDLQPEDDGVLVATLVRSVNSAPVASVRLRSPTRPS